MSVRATVLNRLIMKLSLKSYLVTALYSCGKTQISATVIWSPTQYFPADFCSRSSNIVSPRSNQYWVNFWNCSVVSKWGFKPKFWSGWMPETTTWKNKPRHDYFASLWPILLLAICYFLTKNNTYLFEINCLSMFYRIFLLFFYEGK